MASSSHPARVALPALSPRLLGDLLARRPGGVVRVDEFPALRLRVRPEHVAVSFAYRRADGARREVSLGRWPRDDVRMIRHGHDALEEAVARGDDPKGRFWHGRVLMSLGELVTAWEASSRTKTAPHRARLVRRAFAALLDRPVRQINGPDLTALLDELSPGTQWNAFAVARTIFRWGLKVGHVDFDPMVQVEAPRRRIRDVYPELAFGRLMWREAAELPSPFRELARVQLLLAARSSEIAGMAWGEVQLERRCWTLPAMRAKAQRAQTFALVPPLLAEFERLRRAGAGWNDLVFRTEDVPAVTWRHKRDMMDRFARAAQAQGVPVPDARVIWHDLRRMMGRAMLEAGFERSAIHQCLNHGSAAAAGATVLDQTYMAERQIAITAEPLSWWAAQIVEDSPEARAAARKDFANAFSEGKQ